MSKDSKMFNGLKQAAANYISRGANTSVVNMAKQSEEKAKEVKKQVKARAKDIKKREKVLSSDFDRVKEYQRQLSAVGDSSSLTDLARKAELEEKLTESTLRVADSKEALLRANLGLFGARAASEPFNATLASLKELEQSDVSPKKKREQKLKLLKKISSDPELEPGDKELLLAYLAKATAPDPTSQASSGVAKYDFSKTEFPGGSGVDLAKQSEINKITTHYNDTAIPVAKTTKATKEK